VLLFIKHKALLLCRFGSAPLHHALMAQEVESVQMLLE